MKQTVKKTLLAYWVGMCFLPSMALAEQTNTTEQTTRTEISPNFKKYGYPITPKMAEKFKPDTPYNRVVLPNVNGNDAFKEIPRDDGVDIVGNEVFKDDYRWLEATENPDVEYQKIAGTSFKRNYQGTFLEHETQQDGGEYTPSAHSPDSNDPVTKFSSREKKMALVQEQPKSDIVQWVEKQTQTTLNYLENAPIYDEMKKRYFELTDYVQPKTVVKRGDLRFQWVREKDGFNRIYRLLPNGERVTIADELTIDPTGQTRILTYSFNDKGNYLAYYTRRNSADTDIPVLHIVETESGKAVSRPYNEVPYSGYMMDWDDDDHIFYIKTDVSGWTHIMRHRVGSEHLNDEDIFNPARYNYFFVNEMWEEDGYMVVQGMYGALYLRDLKTGKLFRINENKGVDKVSKSGDSYDKFIASKLVDIDRANNKVYVISQENNRWGDLVEIQIDKRKNRRVIYSSPDKVTLKEAVPYHGTFFVTYTQDTKDHLIQIDGQGKILKDLTPMIGMGTISDLYSYEGAEASATARKENNEDKKQGEEYVSYIFTNAITPSATYKYDPRIEKVYEIKDKDLIDFDPSLYETKQVFYPSKDGTKIPMTISHKKGLKLDGKNPTILYAYGGFNSASTMQFSPFVANWLRHGGVYVHANIRGGDEYGQEWHHAGWRLNKMNVFDDYAAAAKYLSDNGYANKDYLAINGVSNGGLLVGATMTLFPDIARVALPEVGVLDMFRHDKVLRSRGWWKAEYGTANDNKQYFELFKKYSPYHNIRAGVCYPSTMVMTSQRDDRVNPTHSYKFAAKLQETQTCDRPTFLYVAEQHGHGYHTRAEYKNEGLYKTVFTLNEMGIKKLEPLK